MIYFLGLLVFCMLIGRLFAPIIDALFLIGARSIEKLEEEADDRTRARSPERTLHMNPGLTIDEMETIGEQRQEARRLEAIAPLPRARLTRHRAIPSSWTAEGALRRVGVLHDAVKPVEKKTPYRD